MYKSKLVLLGIGLIIITVGVGCRKTAPKEATNFGPGHQDYSKPIQNGYSLYRSSAHDVFVSPEIWSEYTPRIPSEIIRLNHYKSFVLAEIVAPVKEEMPDSLALASTPNALKNDYWILNTQEPSVWGELTEEEFMKKMDSLRIPPTIKLIEVDEY